MVKTSLINFTFGTTSLIGIIKVLNTEEHDELEDIYFIKNAEGGVLLILMQLR